MLIVGISIVIVGEFLLGLFILVRARIRAHKMHSLERDGRSMPAQVTDVRFKAFDRVRVYGRVSFTYEYEGKIYESSQSTEELDALDIMKNKSTHPCALVLPKRPHHAWLALTKDILYGDPTIRKDTIAGFFMMFFPAIPGGLILYGLLYSWLGH